jgi:hypothetical protein
LFNNENIPGWVLQVFCPCWCETILLIVSVILQRSGIVLNIKRLWFLRESSCRSIMMVHMCSALVQEIFLVIFIHKRAKREKNIVLKTQKRWLHFGLTLEGLKLAAAIGTPRLVKATNQRPPRRRKKGPGRSSPHEYRAPSFRDEYSFTYDRSK